MGMGINATRHNQTAMRINRGIALQTMADSGDFAVCDQDIGIVRVVCGNDFTAFNQCGFVICL
jgi:hypothetical protein